MCAINPLLGVTSSAYGSPIPVTHQRTPEMRQTSRNPLGVTVRLPSPPPRKAGLIATTLQESAAAGMRRADLIFCPHSPKSCLTDLLSHLASGPPNVHAHTGMCAHLCCRRVATHPLQPPTRQETQDFDLLCQRFANGRSRFRAHPASQPQRRSGVRGQGSGSVSPRQVRPAHLEKLPE